MTQDFELFDELSDTRDHSIPPLCLVHYFGAAGQGPPPPSIGHIAERNGNVWVIEFAAPPKERVIVRHRKSLLARAADTLILLLLLVSAAACIAAFRF